jgi:hypothetical protein
MEIRFATRSSPGCPNEDAVVAGDDFVAVLDGATAEPDTDSGCQHGVRWFATELAGRLGWSLASNSYRTTPLTEILYDACASLARSHAGTCDLTNPCSPTATVAIVRVGAQSVEYLVLSDATVVLRLATGEVRAVTDDRILRFDDLRWESLRNFRNVPDGFWVAGSNPQAAKHAVVGTIPAADVDQVALFSDGAARLVVRYGWKWSELIEVLDVKGPAEIIALTRAAERKSPQRFDGKRHDDATAAFCVLDPRQAPAGLRPYPWSHDLES